MKNSDKMRMELIKKKLTEVKDLYDLLSDKTKKEITGLQAEVNERLLLENLIKLSEISASNIVDILNFD
jgi:hypothetical protein